MSGFIGRLGGRRVLVALGGLYAVLAVAWPLLVPGTEPLAEIEILGILVGGSGLVLLATGYWLPRTDIHPDLYSTVARWCLGGIGVMLSILLLSAFLGTLDDAVKGALGLTSLASVAGLGMGFYAAEAKTRTRAVEARRCELQRANSKLKRANRELERYETIVETVTDGIYVVDGDGHFTLVNDAYCELTGYDRDELLGAHVSKVVDEETVEAARSREQQLVTGEEETAKVEADVRTATGATIRAEASFALLSEDGDHERVGVVRDVTERIEREQRLESFASMLAHELRNPVNIGQIYSRQLPTDAAPEAIEHVADAFDRIDDMINVMLVLTRGRDAVPEGTVVQLSDVVRTAWDRIEAPEAALRVLSDAEIRADETYLQHLFQNLFENAVEHGGADVTITVGDLSTGFYVEDDGIGIPPAERESVFEAGFTTTSGQGGTGLGLAFVRELADAYEWTYAVAESDAGGARFEFTDVTTTPRVVE